MPLHLTDRQLRRIRDLQELLFEPPDPDRVAAWADALHGIASDLFGAERSLLVLPCGRSRGVLVCASNMEKRTVQGFRRAVVGTGEEINEYMDPVLNQAMLQLAEAGVQVFSQRTAEELTGIALEEMPRIYPEVIEPGRLQEHVGMTQPLPEGQALFHIFADPGGGARLGPDTLAIFELILPAFRIAASGYAAASAHGQLRAALDAVTEAVALYQDGVELFRNRALGALLRSEPQAQELLDVMRRCAGSLDCAARSRDPALAAGGGPSTVTTAANRYRLTPTRLEGGRDGIPLIVMVAVSALVPPLPDHASLRECYRLTARQAEVALLLARGFANREIAARLGISPHTARHHAQAVLEKVGTHTRKALAVRFMADREP